MKKVLVTGGAGCIGVQVCLELKRRGYAVQLLDLPEQIARVESSLSSSGVTYSYGSILDCASIRDAMDGCEAVIHLAAYLGVRRTETNRLRCLEINIQGTKNVLDIAVQHRLKKFVFASSSEVYGEPVENPVRETTITQGKTVYAVSKLAGEELVKAYHQRYPELEYTILRYFNTYGPHQIAQFVIPKFIRNAMEGKSPIVYGDGKQKRSYCYASDTAWATVEAMERKQADGEVINIGNSSEPVILLELADRVIEVCGKKSSVVVRQERKFENTDRTQDREIYERYCLTNKAKDLLGFTAKVSLNEGIRKVMEHGVPHPKWATSDLDYTLDEFI